MKKNILGSAIVLWVTCAGAAVHEDSVLPLVEKCQFKEAISSYQTLLLEAPPEKKAWLQSRLAIVYEKDQDQQKAFQLFLSALEMVPIQTLPQMSSEESSIYNEALKTYMDQSNVSIQETSEKILKDYYPVVNGHPNYYSLKLIVALAEANLGLFENFFVDFYESYQFLPDHHLSFKTKAILHIKLYDRANTKEDKERERATILMLIKKSISLYPSDRSLYKMAIAFSPDGESRRQAVTTYLPMMIDHNIIIPRCDIFFYVKQSIAIQQPDLAQRLIDKAREWYQYSKTIEQAQQLLDQYNKGC